MSALQRKLLRDLLSMKAQVVAIAAVVSAGIALLFASYTVFASLAASRDSYYAKQQFADVFASLERAPARLESQLESIDGVRRLATRTVAMVALDLDGVVEPVQGALLSLPDGEDAGLNRVFLTAGAKPTAGSETQAIVGEKFAAAHGLSLGDTLAAVINGRRRELEVVGLGISPEYTYSIAPGDLFPDPRRFGVLWMAQRPLAAAFDLEGGFNHVSALLNDQGQLEEVLDQLDLLLAPYGGVGAIPRSLQTSHWYLDNELRQLEKTGTVIPMLFLAVAAFLLNVVLVRLVAGQREEIAALKALGYTNFELGTHFAQWAVAVSLLGWLFGVALGLLMADGLLGTYMEYFNFPELQLRLAWQDFALAALFTLGAAALGAVNAVRSVVRLAPAEAMRPPSPPTFRPTTLERLAAWFTFPQTTRMVLRNVARQRVRSTLSILGIAFAAATLVVGGSMVSSITLLMEVLFDRVQRQDVTVTFAQPATAAALHELERFPGVSQVEPMRSVAVRLRHGSRQRQTSITGLVSAPQLLRVLHDSARPVRLPQDRLVLSTQLADELGVAAGDRLQVEVLEGHREHFDIEVALVIEDLVGSSAYLEIRTLHRYLREGGTLSGASLRIDPDRADELYRRLKETPRVAGVGLRQATIDSFNTFLADNLGTMMGFNLFFAFVIAFGVIYNTARVSLAERQRELASLRVLGFRKREIAQVLVGELALLTVIAVPLGLLLGLGLLAWALQAMETELYRLPFAVDQGSLALAAAAVTGSMALSSWIVARRLTELDLVEALKSRE